VRWSSGFFYGTHASILADVACATRGPILELGAGTHSTPILRAVALRMNRTLVTVDHNPRWLDALSFSSSPLHQTVTIKGWGRSDFSSEPLRQLLRQRWALVFVDQGDWWGRLQSIRLLRKRASYICIHDWDALSFASNIGARSKPLVPARESAYWTEFMPRKMPVDCAEYFEECTGPPTLLISEEHDTARFRGSGMHAVGRASWACVRASSRAGGCAEGTLVSEWPTDIWDAVAGDSGWGGYTAAQWERMVGVAPQSQTSVSALPVAGEYIAGADGREHAADGRVFATVRRRRQVLPVNELGVVEVGGPHI
jgi:hypothetical protein